MAIEMVDFPIDSMVIFHSYVTVYQRVPQRVKVYMTGRGKKSSSRSVEIWLWLNSMVYGRYNELVFMGVFSWFIKKTFT